MSAPSLSQRAKALFRSVLEAVFVPRSYEIIWRLLERVVVVPTIAGSRAGGPLDTGRMPQWRGLLERYDAPHVHYFTMAKAARIGGTLFFGICLIIEKVLRRPGPIGWLDPTKATAKRVSRGEITPFLEACPALMRIAIVSKTTWMVLEKTFINCALSLVGSGSINDLGGRQFELAIINEQDRIRGWKEGEPTPSNEMEVRTSQFARTRKIVRNCTPFAEGGLTWAEFIAGSQDHSYQPCPECHGYQRLTFTREPAEPERWMLVGENDPLLACLDRGKDAPSTTSGGVEATGPEPVRRSRRKPESERHAGRSIANKPDITAPERDVVSENREAPAGVAPMPNGSRSCSSESSVSPAQLPINHPEDPRNVSATRPPDSHRPDPKHIRKAPGGYLIRGIPQTGRVHWPDKFKDKRTGRWDIDGAAAAARYECAFCRALWTPDQLTATHRQYQLRSHNPGAPREHVSAHLSTLHSPWHTLDVIVRQWLLAEGSITKVKDFFSLWLGIPAPCPPTKVTPKHIALLQAHSPRYERQFPEHADAELRLPARPVLMTMHADVNQDGCRYTIRALMPDGARYLLAWGIAGGFTELDKIASRVWHYDWKSGVSPDPSTDDSAPRQAGTPDLLRFEPFSPYTTIGGNPIATCIIDTGWKTKSTMGVYQFIADMGGKWIGVKGGKFAGLGKEKPVAEETMTFNYPGRGQLDIPVIQANDFTLTEHFSRFVLKERRPPGYYLPIALDDAFIAELTAPHLTKRPLFDGRTEDVWTFECDPHFYDCEKYGEVLGFIFEPALLQQFRTRQDTDRAALLAKLAKG